MYYLVLLQIRIVDGIPRMEHSTLTHSNMTYPDATQDAQILEILQLPRSGYCTHFEEIQALGATSPHQQWSDDDDLLNSVQTLLFDWPVLVEDSADRLARSVDVERHSPPALNRQQLARMALDIVQRSERPSHRPPDSVAVSWTDRTTSDYPKLLSYLRALRRDIGIGTCMTGRMFIDVEKDSPLFASVDAFGAVLKSLNGLIRFLRLGQRAAADSDEELVQGISEAKLRAVLERCNTGELNFSKPYRCLLNITPVGSGYVYVLQLYGVSGAGVQVSCTLSDRDLRYVQLTARLNPLASHLTQAAVRSTVVIRDDVTLSLRCLLAYYGVAIPKVANPDDLSRAITDLLPKESHGQNILVKPGLPFTIAEQPSFVLDTSEVYGFRQRTVEERGTDDYTVIAQEIKKESRWHLERYQKLLTSYQRFGSSQQDNEKALLALLQQAGGITLKLVVYDSDGEDDIYREQHTVNPWNASDLTDYFSKAESALSSYMINTIEYGEGEGAINIERLSVEMIAPNIAQRTHHLRQQDIEAFKLYSKEPPFLFLDPLAKGAYEIISARFADISNELRNANWDIARCATLTQAADYLLAQRCKDRPNLTAPQRDAAYLNCLNDAANVYYSVIAESLESQQRLKIMLQPTQPEFAARAICRYLQIDEHHWTMITQADFDIRYEASWKNTGTFAPHQKSAGYRTLLSVVYDEQLRREIGLADDYDELMQALAQAIANKSGNLDRLNALKTRLAGLFDANIAFVQNGNLPAELTRPEHAFSVQVEAYTAKAAVEFEALEAERIILTSSNAAERLARLRLHAVSGVDNPVFCLELLTVSEKRLLDTRVQGFAAFLRARANNDDIQDMSTAGQHVLQVVRQVGGLIPVVGNFINLGFDLYEGNTEGIALDALNIFAELVLLKFRAMPPRILGTLMLQGTNLWMMWQHVQALKDSIKANDYPGSVASFGFLLLGMHSALQCGISVVHGFQSAVAARVPDSLTQTSGVVLLTYETRQGSGDEAGPGYQTERPMSGLIDEAAAERPGASTRSPYWAISEDGRISTRQTGRKVTGADWNGNAIVEGGARAVLLGGINEKTYMLNGLAHRAVRGAAGLELRPLHTLDIEAGQWKKRPQAGERAVEFSRFAHTQAFPTQFSGRPERPQAPANAVSWYDNCIASFDNVSTQVTDLNGRQTRENIAVGVIEQKYVTERDGHVEVLEHVGSANGITRFIRIDGSRLETGTTLPAIPLYKPSIQARIVAAHGIFVTVEISQTLEGLEGKKTVAGVLATRTEGGGQELIIEADRGVHYRGTLGARDALALTPGEVSTRQQPVELALSKISPDADPKRASPALWHSDADYKNTIAHDDFALELFYGAKAANEAYARNPRWVKKSVEAVGKIKAQLPPSITTVENPFYMLDTREELAILFAPRNQAALANTLLGKTIEWGAASRSHVLNLGEKVLRQLRLREPLLSAGDVIPVAASERVGLVQRLQGVLGGANLLLAEAEGQNGEKVYFAHCTDEGLMVKAGPLSGELHLSSSGSIIDHIEAHFPDPSALKGITVLSVNEVSETDARRIFLSSQRGYSYESVTSIETPVEQSQLSEPELQLQIDDVHYPARVRDMSIGSVVVDLSTATAITRGPRAGSYVKDGRDYVLLDNGRVYRATWDSRNGVFVLVPPEGKLLENNWAYPWVRHTGGREFTLINRPSLKGGVRWRETTISNIRTRNYERATTGSGRLTAAQRNNANELQVHHEDLHLMHSPDSQNGKLNVPSALFGRNRPGRDGYVTLKSRFEVPESCISSTEYLVSRYAGGTSGFDYEGERAGQAAALEPNVEVVARLGDGEVALNISAEPLDDWIRKEGHSDWFADGTAFPEIGEGVGFIERYGSSGRSSDYEFHFMFVAGKVLDHEGNVTAVLATDLSEPARKSVKGVSTKLPASKNWNVQLYQSVDEMRGAGDPDGNHYPVADYYSVRVRPVRR
ncbi:MAG TPA: hypothetical protein VF682_08170 [Pseudomonas sp.]|jgi:hypothetical protein